jgi:hypothetical protein
MRFVRHPVKAQWGLGVIAAEDGSHVVILFEGVGQRKIARTFKGLEEIPDAVVPANHPLRKREDWPKVERDGRRAEAKRELPKRFDSFVKEFLSIFPGGLQSKQCEDQERTYKVDGSQFALQELDVHVLRKLLERGSHRDPSACAEIHGQSEPCLPERADEVQ